MIILTQISGYTFHDWRMEATRGTDKQKLQAAVDAVCTAMSILEGIDDEYEFPVSEYETL